MANMGFCLMNIVGESSQGEEWIYLCQDGMLALS
jgi:hypothetical protein